MLSRTPLSHYKKEVAVQQHVQQLNNNTMSNFQELIDRNQLTLVDFFATWCGPCQMLAPVLEEVKKELQDDISIIKIDVDKNTALTTQYSTQYQMRGVPTLMLFRKGKLLWKQSGYMDKQTLLGHIDQYKHNYKK
ncbi:thioredoxin [Myroides odoratimimus]|nr:thioredoxin [Myroides odoratimimus]MCO7722144.1 thioredoxin [Myroides odoratimimus]WHT74220.1 thioredoxin [Myroides odoratimimus]WHU38801.1 thioredoxin [Myroides odoratimimus]